MGSATDRRISSGTEGLEGIGAGLGIPAARTDDSGGFSMLDVSLGYWKTAPDATDRE